MACTRNQPRPNWATDIMQRLHDMQQKQLFCDTILESANGVQFPVHGCLFASVSNVFHQKLLRRAPEKFIITTEVSGEALGQFVQDTYCGRPQSRRLETDQDSLALEKLGVNLPSALYYEETLENVKPDIDEPELLSGDNKQDVERLEQSLDNTGTASSDDTVIGDLGHHEEASIDQASDPKEYPIDTQLPSEQKPIVHEQDNLGQRSSINRRDAGQAESLSWQYCDKTFRNQRTMIQRSANHTGSHSKPYACERCDKKYSSQRGLANHVKCAHPDSEKLQESDRSVQVLITDHKLSPKQKKKVPKTIQFSETERKLAKTAKLKRKDRPSDSLEQQDTFKSTSTSFTDEKTEHTCAICSKVFKHRCSLQNHITAHTGVKRYKCPLCEEHFNLTSALKAHFVTHETTRSLASDMARQRETDEFCCSVCQKHFADEAEFITHQASHLKVLRHVCGRCGMRFDKRYLLTLHVTGHKPPGSFSKASFLCSECGASLTSKSNLTIHQRIHSGEFPFKCSLCPKRFRGSSNCRQHERAHPENRKFLCRFCPKKFGFYRGLVDHERTHTKETFKCRFCSQQFTMKRFMLLHEKIHTGDHPFKCQFCPKAMPSRAQLVIHERRHTGERPFKCDTCGKGFFCLYGLRSHHIVHTGEKPYPCNICGTSFTKGSHLQRHNRRFHSSEADA